MKYGLVALLAFGLTLGGCATEAVQRREAMEQKIAKARTRADHEDLAGWYEREAKAAKDQAAIHRRMRNSYSYLSPFGTYSASSFLQHCENLVRQYDLAVAENLALAKLHRQLAAEAKE